MFSGLTRQEQRVLLLLIGVILLGLAIDYYKTSRRNRALWVEVPLKKETVATGTQAQSPAALREPAEVAPPPDPSAQRGKIDINRATPSQLHSIAGVTDDVAQKIIALRDKHGGFRSAEELLDVQSVDQSVLANVLRSVYVPASIPASITPSAPAMPPRASSDKVNINTATVDQLKSLNLIGEVLAQRIVEYRTRNGPFRKPEDIMNVRGISKGRYEANKDRLTVK
jgi:competence protein ComEA